MSAQASDPINKSFLSPVGFKFTMQRLPHVNYFSTGAAIPDVSLGQLQTEAPFVKLPQPGDKLTFSNFELTFRVDEDMRNYREIFDWLIALGYPDNFLQRSAITRTAISTGDVFSDGSLIITTAAYQPNIEVKFIDMYPVSLSTLNFNIEQTDIEYVQATATFAYRRYELTSL